jgi:acyl-coenzyme A synthetase/AMP-(fatty) acid ligase
MPFRATADRRGWTESSSAPLSSATVTRQDGELQGVSSVVFVDSLPSSESNKINWRLLQDAEWKR